MLSNFRQRNMWKNYFGVISLLLVALIVFVVISFCMHENHDSKFRHATFAETLLKNDKNDTTNSDNENLTDTTVSLNETKIELDTATQNILIIGDSMLEGLNRRLGDYAKANGHSLNSVIWYSSTTEYWGTCDTLSVFINRFKPTFIFISLGGNELFVRDIKEKRTGFLKNILKQIGDIPFVWIGPPNWKPDTGINDMVQENVGKGNFFLSNGMHFDRQKDGAHPTYESAGLWFDSIARWMPDHASHPIRLEKPADSIKGRPQRVVVLQPKR